MWSTASPDRVATGSLGLFHRRPARGQDAAQPPLPESAATRSGKAGSEPELSQKTDDSDDAVHAQIKGSLFADLADWTSISFSTF